ncbi:MAG: LLM class flavin-dependent oxidoreductase [Nitrososphaerales archaeon]
MKFGLALPVRGDNCRRELLVDAAKTAEDMGFDSIWVWDHYMTPSSNALLDAWILLSHLAAVTSKVSLGSLVTPIPFRPPGMLAKMVATADILSGGRVILGVGAGWHRPEFEGYSVWDDDATRVAKTREGLRLILKLWTEDKVDFEGRYYSARGAVLEPKPVQKPHPPLWFGSFGSYMLKLTARYGEGWIPVHISSEEYGEAKANLLRHMKSMGKKRMIFSLFDNEFSSPDDLQNKMEAFKDAGCEYYVPLWNIGEEDYKKKLKKYVDEVLPSFR